MHSRLKHFFKRSERHQAKPLLFNDSDVFQLHSPQKSMDESTPSLPCSLPRLNYLHSPGNGTSSLPPPPQDSSYLKNETSSLPPPPQDSSYLKNETSSLPPPPQDSSYLKNETSSLPPPPQDSSYLKNETSSLPPPPQDSSYLKNETSSLPPPPQDSSYLKNETSSLPPPPQDSSYLKNETSSLPPPPQDSSYLKNETSSLPPPPQDSSYLKNETSSLPPPPQDSSYLKNETSSLPPSQEDGNYIKKLSPPAEDYQPKNESFTIFPSCHSPLHDEDELSFLNSSIPLLPPPMPSLQVLSRIHLPFQAPAQRHAVPPTSLCFHHHPKVLNKTGKKLTWKKEEGRAIENHRLATSKATKQ